MFLNTLTAVLKPKIVKFRLGPVILLDYNSCGNLCP